jgi:hypothetical protein
MVGANFMASLAAPEVNPDRCPAGPTGRPSVDGAPHACPRTICTARTTTPQSHIPYRFFHASVCRFLYAIAGRRALH